MEREWDGERLGILVVRQAEEGVGLIETKLNISPVQTIGMECIASGKLVGSNVTCLVHGKLGQMNGRAVDLTVRTRDPRLSDSMQRVATEILQGAP